MTRVFIPGKSAHTAYQGFFSESRSSSTGVQKTHRDWTWKRFEELLTKLWTGRGWEAQGMVYPVDWPRGAEVRDSSCVQFYKPEPFNTVTTDST